MRLIEADALHEALKAKQKWVVRCGDKHNEGYTYDQVHFAIDDAPTIDAVPLGAYEQARWERDTAIAQLAEIGKSLCEKMDNVATVVRCKDCKHWGMHKSLNVPWCYEMHIDKSEDGYCDSGKRREDATN